MKPWQMGLLAKLHGWRGTPVMLEGPSKAPLMPPSPSFIKTNDVNHSKALVGGRLASARALGSAADSGLASHSTMLLFAWGGGALKEE